MAKDRNLLTADKLQEVKSNPETLALANLLTSYSITPHTINDKKRELSLDTILTICSKVSGLPASVIRGRKNYDYDIIQSAFRSAAVIYTGLSVREIAEYCGCQMGTVQRSLRSISWYLKDERKYLPLAVYLECEWLSKKRLAKHVNVPNIDTLKKLAKVEKISNPIAFLHPDKIKSFPVRQLDWFGYSSVHLNQEVIAYRTDGKAIFSIAFDSDEARKAAHKLQDFGFRFTYRWGKDFINDTKDCKTCSLGKNGKCPAAILESYFCPKQVYDKDMNELASITTETSKSFKKFIYN